MIVFGITGGTGAGKTSALRVLERLGAYLIDCDALYYEMLRPGEAIHSALHETFGGGIFTPGGTLDRQKLGDRVFGAAAELEKLNAIVFTHLGAELSGQF